MVTGTLALFFLTVLSGVVGWAVRDRSARQTRLSGQLELILDDVARLERDEKWVDALASARRAESALATGEAAPDIKNRMLQALADLEFVDRLEGIRAQSGTVWGQPDRSLIPVAVRADQNYATAFREEGIDVDTLPTIVAAQRITARTAIALALLPALDDWVAVRSKAKGEHATRRLVEVLKVADPDPWRQQVRDCLARKDWPTLESLARSPDLDRQPAATLSFLCAALRVNGKFLLEIEVVRRAQWKYPADFWFNHRLGLSLIWLQWPDHVREGIGYMHAAVAIRPNSAHAIMNLGNGYAFLKEHDKAIACFQKAIELCPKYWICWGNLGISLGRKGLHDEAISALETSIRLKPDLATEAYAELSIIHSCRPEVDRRSPRDATEFAEKAVELEPQASNHWTVLGIARYREHQWEEARSALHKSQQLAAHSSYGVRWHEAINWFFLAMSHWQLGQHNIAREHYDRAIQGMDKWPMAQTDDHLLLRVRTEAEEMLNIATTKTNPN